MNTQFDSNTFEHDYIISVLMHMVTDLKTMKPVEQIIDKYAVSLTAFMTGQIVQAVKGSQTKGRYRARFLYELGFTTKDNQGDLPMAQSADKKRFQAWFEKHQGYSEVGDSFRFLLWNAWLMATQTEREGSACLKALKEIRQEIAAVNCDADHDIARGRNAEAQDHIRWIDAITEKHGVVLNPHEEKINYQGQGYWCVVCERLLFSDENGVIVHDDKAHPSSMAFDDDGKPQ